jgi:sugar lactone lactonase YvrE
MNTAWPMPASIGCFALRMRGGFVAALRDGIWFVDRDGKPERRIADAPYDPAHHRFNDGRVDAQGRLWAGTMNEQRDANTAALYRLEANLKLTPVITDIMISNGLAFSPDGGTMYHADTPTRTVHAYDFDTAGGSVSNRREFARFGGGLSPRRAVVDREGCAGARSTAAAVVRLSAQGKLLAEYPVPALCPTMCAFGGPDTRTIYVTSARQYREPAELARLPQSGGIFAMRVDTPGQVEPKFAS